MFVNECLLLLRECDDTLRNPCTAQRKGHSCIHNVLLTTTIHAMEQRVTLAIYARTFKRECMQLYDTIINELIAHKCRILMANNLYHELCDYERRYAGYDIVSFSPEMLKGDILAVLSIGGDGTFLEAAKMVMGENIPVLGINNGRLGFLAQVNTDKVSEAISALLSGNYRLAPLDVLSLYANGQRQAVDFALNEFAVSKSDNSSMLTIHAYVDGDYLTTYWADGLIIATSTGSTAYSMSVGGPIVYPSSPNFIIIPIAPHNLTVRPLVVPSSVVIQLRVEGRGANILTSLDGRTHIMDCGAQLRIAKTPFDVKMVQLDGYSFFGTLRDKLMWGADPRNA